METEQKILIEMKDLSFIREGRPLLDHISVSIPENTVTVITGIAGSGKTTFLKAAAGLLIPDYGILKIHGKDFSSFSIKELLSLRRKNGFVFQDAALWSNKTIEENLLLPIQYHYPDVPLEEIRAKIDYWIKRTGFWDTIKGRPAAYSMGERKMISFIRALITEPNILFLDTPSEMLDNAGVSKMLEILHEQKDKNISMIISSQHPEIIRNLADLLIVIDEGKIIESAPVEQIVTSENSGTRKVMKHVTEAVGIDYNKLLDSVESVLEEKELIDIEDRIEKNEM
ncbi:MAG: ATP-binding cassette domain-containing protein [Spirochaetales bacterium]|nr:ATP-binding cassette domain-containing protein [Spirochaetales bacterium]